MPEYKLDLGDVESTQRFAALDRFTQGYVTAAFWTGDEDSSIPVMSFSQLSPDALKTMVDDCAQFQKENAAALAVAYQGGQWSPTHDRYPYDERSAGVDLWLTRNGHGAGYWDRDLPGTCGTELSTAARRMG